MEACTSSVAADPSFARLTGRRRPPSDRPPLPSTLPPPPALPSTLPPPPPPPAVPVNVALELARLYPVIRRAVRVLHRDDSTAEDLDQEAALRVLVKWERFVPPPGTADDARRARRAWVARIAFYVVREWHEAARTQKRAAELVTDPADMEAAVGGAAPDAETLAIGLETLREFEGATTPERWYAFYAHHVEGRTGAIIARETGAPVNTVYTWIRLAAEDIRAYLARREAAERGAKPRK